MLKGNHYKTYIMALLLLVFICISFILLVPRKDKTEDQSQEEFPKEVITEEGNVQRIEYYDEEGRCDRLYYLDSNGKRIFNLRRFLYANPVAVIIFGLILVFISLLLGRKANMPLPKRNWTV
ncbi:MAG: hypothetical protein K6E28_04820 [Eubacterium sp.]|nr:hypothetical protein [Eubacterium sp.]